MTVIDVPPALGGLSDAALRAADAVLVPVAADFLALDALRSTLAAVRAASRRPATSYAPLAMLPTFVDRRRATADAVELLHEQFGDLLLAGGIPRSARFDAAALRRRADRAHGAPQRPGDRLRGGRGGARHCARRQRRRSARRRRRPAVKRFVRADMREALRDIRRPPPATAASAS